MFIFITVAHSVLVKVGGSTKTIRRDDVWCYNDPDIVTSLECHVDDTIRLNDVEPIWTAKKGNISPADITSTKDHRLGNLISIYTFVTGHNTASVLNCACESPILQCRSPVTITIKGMF